MKPIEAYYLIRKACLRRPELKFKNFPDNLIDDPIIFPDNPYLGFCYISTLVFCDLIPQAVHYRSEVGSHHWAEIQGKVWDLTAEQFKNIFPYNIGVKVPRKNNLTVRAKELRRETLEQ